MGWKKGIFDPIEQAALLGACRNDQEYIPIWLMLNCGIHCSDLTNAKEKLHFNGDFLEYKRAKNQKPRREMIPADLIPRMENWLKKGQKISRVGYFMLVARVGTRVGHPEYSPMTLRHTFCIQQLRVFANNPDPIKLVAAKMGCEERVVIQNYMDVKQWEQVQRGHDIL